MILHIHIPSINPTKVITISRLNANSIKDMGKVMGELKKEYADEIDFAKAGALLKQLLNK